MAGAVITKISDYIVSPLAMGTHANYECVKAGKTMLRKYDGKWNLPEPFVASLMDDSVLGNACDGIGCPEGYTKFEKMSVLAASRALEGTGIKADDNRVIFIISTTKGNIELLDGKYAGLYPESRVSLPCSARIISGWFNNPNEPVVVCNACISGLHAQIEAFRFLESGRFDYAVVIGTDVLSPFIVSGFQSLKAMSADLCRPFDEDRTGLNLGEASACVIYARGADGRHDRWHMEGGMVRNDAFHVSSPSKKAEGAFLALERALDGRDLSDIAFVNLHGTATMFNDEMEAVALDRAGLGNLPANGLKGYFGHTLGASGVLETLVSMEALDDRTVLATKGFRRAGISRDINISDMNRPAEGRAFLKMMSGFGGCNAAMLFRKGNGSDGPVRKSGVSQARVAHSVYLTEREAVVDGVAVDAKESGMSMLKELYAGHVKDYPKFYKMDPLCRLAFIATELLLKAESGADGAARFIDRDDRALVFAGKSASICSDRAFCQTMQYPGNYFPSPSAFIYTLPNILAGEIAIRNRYHGETVYFSQETPECVETLMRQALSSSGTDSVAGGWIEMENEEKFEAKLYIIE